MVDQECPPKAALEAFMLGRMSDNDLHDFANHVQGCENCRARLESLQSETIRHSANSSSESNSLGSDSSPELNAQTILPGSDSAVGKSTERVGDHDTHPQNSLSSTRPSGATDGSHVGSQFGRYEIQATLGAGGMGAVYLAHDPELDRKLAIKVPFSQGAEKDAILDRFRREARAVAQITHPNICQIYDVSEVDGTPYMAMAYIEGKPLSKYIQPDKPIPPKQAVWMARMIALALAHAHNKGIIHRDLKPDNIMIDERKQPVIMDFGLAKRQGTGDTKLTHVGDLMGTPTYMSPEQVSGKVEDMGTGCDIYSLGVILYELLTGQVPFKGDLLSVLSAIALDTPKPPSQICSSVDSQLDALCLKAMEKQPSHRYQSMDEFAAALLAYFQGESQGRENTVSTDEIKNGFPLIDVAPREKSNPKLKIDVDRKSNPKRPTKRKSAAKIDVAKSPSSLRRHRKKNSILRLFFAAGIALVSILSFILYLQMGGNTIRVVVSDPSISVELENHQITVLGLDGERKLTLVPGLEKLRITMGDSVLVTEAFELTDDDDQTVLSVEVVGGVPMALRDGEPLKATRSFVRGNSTLAQKPRASQPSMIVGPDMSGAQELDLDALANEESTQDHAPAPPAGTDETVPLNDIASLDPNEHRQAVELVLSRGAKAVVTFGGESITIESVDQVPDERFEIRGVIQEGLHPHENALTDADCKRLSNFSTIDHLELSGTHVTVTGLQSFQHPENISYLSPRRHVKDSGEEVARRYSNVVYLRLPYDTADQWAESFSGHDKLETADFYRSQVGYKGIAAMTKAPNVRIVNLMDCKLDSSTIRRLVEYPKLESLSITIFEDQTADDFLPLSRSRTLKSLHLDSRNPSVAEELQTRLKSLMPNCKISGEKR